MGPWEPLLHDPPGTSVWALSNNLGKNARRNGQKDTENYPPSSLITLSIRSLSLSLGSS